MIRAARESPFLEEEAGEGDVHQNTFVEAFPDDASQELVLLEERLDLFLDLSVFDATIKPCISPLLLIVVIDLYYILDEIY